MRVTYDNKVGIGDTSPTEGKLVVAGTGAYNTPPLHISMTSSTTFNHFANMVDSNLTAGENGIIVFGQELDTKNSAYIGYVHRSDHGDDNQLTLGFWGSNNLVNLLPNGNVGVGLEDPTAPLHIFQATASYAKRDMHGIRIQNTHSTAANAFMLVNGVGYSEMGVNSHANGDTNRSAAWITDSSHQFWVDGYNVGTEHFRIAADGTLTATDTTIGSISDERTKQNIQTYSGSLSMINTLRPVTFEWKSDRKDSGRHRGFIAQEVTSSDDYWVTSSSIEPHAPDWGYLEGMPQIDSGAPTGSRSALISKLTEKDTMYVSAIQELTQAVRDLRAMITGSTDLNQLKAQVSSSSFV